MVRMCHGRLPQNSWVVVLTSVKRLVVLERDRPVGDVEDEGAEGAVVVFPAAMLVLEIVVGESFDRLLQGRSRPADCPGLREAAAICGRMGSGIFSSAASQASMSLDLAGIAAAVVIRR